MAIHEWPETERPRERLLSQGPEALSDAELLAIFLRTGIAGKSAVDLARELLHRFGGLRGLLTATRSEFCAARGLGAAKYALLQATLEMGRRHLRERLVRGGPITCPEEIRDFLTARLRDSRREVFAVLFLDNRHRVLQFEELFHGTIDGASVYPREVVRRALECTLRPLYSPTTTPRGSQSQVERMRS